MTSTPSLPFSVLSTQRDVSWPALVGRWQEAEALGFDGVWIGDHFASVQPVTAPYLDGWTLLPALAALTERVRIGVLVTCFVYRAPALLARQALAVDHISNGRLELGLGAGYAVSDHTMPGIAFWPGPERLARFGEFVPVTEQMLRQPVTTHAGRYYQVEAAVMQPPPVQCPRPPITIAAHGPGMLKLTALYADRWNSFGGAGLSPEQALAVTQKRNQQLDRYCLRLGRDPRQIARSFLVGATGEPAWQSAAQFAETVARYREIGINEFIFVGPQDDAERRVAERVARDLLPELRAAMLETGRTTNAAARTTTLPPRGL